MMSSNNVTIISGELLNTQPCSETYVEMLYLDGHVVRRREGVRRFSQLL